MTRRALTQLILVLGLVGTFFFVLNEFFNALKRPSRLSCLMKRVNGDPSDSCRHAPIQPDFFVRM